MNENSREIPIRTDPLRMSRHIDILNFGSDYDSEYANHPPPTDSEIEIEINPLSIGMNNRMHNNNINRIYNRSMNRSSNNNSIQNSINSTHSNSINNDSDNDVSRNLLFGLASTAMEDLYRQQNRLKKIGLKRLNIKQHIIVTICRDIPIYAILKNFVGLISQWYKLVKKPYNNVMTVRATEFFLASLWCLVSALLSYTILDGLMVRWMVIYAIHAVIVRILSMSLIIVLVVEMFNYTFNNEDNEFCLTVWIFISCVLTIFFIIQCFISNNLSIEGHLNSNIELSKSRSRSNTLNNNLNYENNIDNNNNNNNNNNSIVGNYIGNCNSNEIHNFNDENEISQTKKNQGNSGITEYDNIKNKVKRKVDLYNLIVFAVVPIGVASFISTVGLVRLLVILRLDIGIEMYRIQQNV